MAEDEQSFDLHVEFNDIDPAGQIAQSLASQARPRRRPSALADDWPLDGVDDLARALGGDATSWTGDALRLIAKSDAEHRRALRDGIPDLVRAWELWQRMAPTPTAAEFLAELDRAPATGAFTCPRCGRTSHHPDDLANGYCGACHDWTGRSMTDDQVLSITADALRRQGLLPTPVERVATAIHDGLREHGYRTVRADRQGSSDELGHVVIVYNQASRQPDLHSDGLLDLEEARTALDNLQRLAQTIGRRETYAIGVVTLLEDTTGDDR